MRGRDDAHVDRNGLGRAHGPHFAFLQHAQELDLQRQRHVADLVEQERAAVGGLEQPLVRLHRPRERAAGVTEQLGLEKLRRDRPAVDRDERLVPARARAMNRAREELLAGARFAVDQDARVGVGHELGLAQEVFHQRAAGDDALAPLAGGGVAAAGIVAGKLQRRRDLLQQLLAVERLGQEAEHAALRCRHGVRNGPVRGQDQHGEAGMLAIDGVEQLQAVDARHAQVGDHRRRPPHRDGGERRLAALGGAHAIAGRREPQADQLQKVGIVIDQ